MLPKSSGLTRSSCSRPCDKTDWPWSLPQSSSVLTMRSCKSTEDFRRRRALRGGYSGVAPDHRFRSVGDGGFDLLRSLHWEVGGFRSVLVAKGMGGFDRFRSPRGSRGSTRTDRQTRGTRIRRSTMSTTTTRRIKEGDLTHDDDHDPGLDVLITFVAGLRRQRFERSDAVPFAGEQRKRGQGQ